MEGLDRPGDPPQTVQGHPQQLVSRGVVEPQHNRGQGRIRGLLGPALFEQAACESDVCRHVLMVDRDRLATKDLRVRWLFGLEQSLRLRDFGRGGIFVCELRAGEVGEGRVRISFQQALCAEQHIEAEGIRVGHRAQSPQLPGLPRGGVLGLIIVLTALLQLLPSSHGAVRSPLLEGFERGPRFRRAAQSLVAAHQADSEAVFLRPLRDQLLRDPGRVVVTSGVHVGSRLVVAQLTRGLRCCTFTVLVGLLDVAQCDQLAEGLMLLCGVQHQVLRMRAVLPGHRVPTRDGPHVEGALEHVHERLAVHVLSHREAHEHEYRGSDIQQVRAVHLLVRLDPWPFHHQDSLVAVLDCRAGRLDGDGPRTQVSTVESMVRNEDHRDVVASEVEEHAEHHVVETIAALHHSSVELETARVHALHSGRMVTHERVGEVVDPVVVHGHEVPGLELHKRGRGRVRAGALAQDLAERQGPGILVRIDLAEPRQEGTDVARLQFIWADLEIGQGAGQSWRVDRPRRQGPGNAPGLTLAEPVRHHHPADRLSRMGWPPPHNVAREIREMEDVPDRSGLAGQIRDRPDAVRARIGLGEAEDAMLEWTFARGDRGPQHGRERRGERGQAAHDSLLREASQIGHRPRLHQGDDHVPIGPIPADEQDPLWAASGGATH